MLSITLKELNRINELLYLYILRLIRSCDNYHKFYTSHLSHYTIFEDEDEDEEELLLPKIISLNGVKKKKSIIKIS